MATSCFRLNPVSEAGLSCEWRPTGSSRDVEANFGEVSTPALRADRRRFLSAVSNFCSPNLMDGGEKKHQQTVHKHTGSHRQQNSGCCLAAEDKPGSLFGTGAERALRQTTAGLLLL